MQRHSKSKNKSVTDRQKAQFARVRSKVQNRGQQPSLLSNDGSALRSKSPLPMRKSPKPFMHSHLVQKWSTSEPRWTGRREGNNMRLASPDSEVNVRIGPRAFASQLDTTIAAHSITSRPASLSRESMLFDEFDQPKKSFQNRESAGLPQKHGEMDSTAGTSSGPATSVYRESLDISPFALSVSHNSTRASDGRDSEQCSTTSLIQEAQAAQDDSRFEADLLGTFKSDYELVHNPARHASHNPSEDRGNHGATSWQKFVQEEGVAFSCRGNYGTQTLRSPQAGEYAQQKPFYPASIRANTPHSSYPTTRVCDLQTGPPRKTGAEAINREQRLDSDDQAWKDFVLGREDSE